MDTKIRIPFDGRARVTFKFGANPEWYTRVFGYPHNGVDWGMKPGREILACDDGQVVFADNVPDSDGCGIIIKHKWGTSLYWHLSRLSVTAGHRVKKGDSIGLSGQTGFATGPHLHFGIKVTGYGSSDMRYWVDPLDFLEKEIPGVYPDPIEPRYHRVMIGESLWAIATKHYGNGAFWTKIYEANRTKINHPALIYPFQKLLIP